MPRKIWYKILFFKILGFEKYLTHAERQPIYLTNKNVIEAEQWNFQPRNLFKK